MPTTTIITTTTAANAGVIAAAARASKAQDAACAAMMETFTSKGATPKARQTYAECVERLRPPTQSETNEDKVVVGSLLAAAIIGAVWGAVFFEEDAPRAFGAFLGALLGMFCVFVLFLIIAAVAFIAS